MLTKIGAMYADSSSDSSSAVAKETEVSLDEKIAFLELVVIPSFSEANRKQQTREIYVEERVRKICKDHKKIDMLLSLAITIDSAKDATEDMESAKAERKEERLFQLELTRLKQAYPVRNTATGISLDDKIKFLEYIVKPSFREAEKRKQTREQYTGERAREIFKDDNIMDMLIPLSTTIDSEEGATDYLNTAKTDRREERQFLLAILRGECHSFGSVDYSFSLTCFHDCFRVPSTHSLSRSKRYMRMFSLMCMFCHCDIKML